MAPQLRSDFCDDISAQASINLRVLRALRGKNFLTLQIFFTTEAMKSTKSKPPNGLQRHPDQSINRRIPKTIK
ncbi:hypothetical protein JCM31598_33670 [Desulfonatronum parangueonense]